MPKVFINYKQYKEENIGSFIRAKIIQKKKRVGDLAEIIGVTPQGMTYKLNNNVFTYGDLLSIIEFLELEDFEILGLMKLRGV